MKELYNELINVIMNDEELYTHLTNIDAINANYTHYITLMSDALEQLKKNIK